MNAFFVTGTDTEIGKTTITAGLVRLGAQAGLRTVAVKPIAAGQELRDGVWVNDDVACLRAAASVALSDADVGPLQLRTPCAPHIAAHIEGVAIERMPLLNAVRATLARGELGFVEGVGGFRVPLTDGWDTADMAVDLGLPVILVVGLRLGCINHALLTAEAIRARGLVLAGWVANAVERDMPHAADNLVSLAAGIQAPLWGVVPRLHAENGGNGRDGTSPAADSVAAHLRLEALQQAMRDHGARPT